MTGKKGNWNGLKIIAVISNAAFNWAAIKMICNYESPRQDTAGWNLRATQGTLVCQIPIWNSEPDLGAKYN